MREKLVPLEFIRIDNLELDRICETLEYLFEENTLNPLMNLKAALAQLEAICSFPGPNQRTAFTTYSGLAITFINNLINGLDPEDPNDPLPHPENKKVRNLAQLNLPLIETAREAALKGEMPTYIADFGPDLAEKPQYIKQLPGGSKINIKGNVLSNLSSQNPNLQTASQDTQTTSIANLRNPQQPGQIIKEIRNKIYKEKFNIRLLEVFAPATASGFTTPTAPATALDPSSTVKTFANETAPKQQDVTSGSLDAHDRHAAEIDKLLYQLKIAHNSQNPVIPSNPQQYRELPTNDFNNLANAAIREIQKGLFTYHKNPVVVQKIQNNIAKIRAAAVSGGQFIPEYLISEIVGSQAYAQDGPAITKEMLGSYFKEDTTTGAIATFVKPLEDKPIKRTPKSFLDYVSPTGKSYKNLLKHTYSKNTHHAAFSEAGTKKKEE